MPDYTFACLGCGAKQTVQLGCGRKPQFCNPCRVERKNTKARAARATLRVTPTACQQCGGPMPVGCRANAKWCSSACQSFHQRRASGQVAENTRNCISCGASLAGMYAHTRVCRSLRCRSWSARHPGVPHPTTRLRLCDWCGKPIGHRNAKARFCGRLCDAAAARAADRDGHNAKARAWQSTEKGQAYRRAYQRANAEERRRWASEARQRNPERYRGYWRQWVTENPGKVRENEHRRRARLLGNPGSIGLSLRDWQRLVRRYRGCCAYCGKVADPLHMDHVIPLARGGRHAVGNVLPACQRCNQTKHAMFLVVWRYRRRRAA